MSRKQVGQSRNAFRIIRIRPCDEGLDEGCLPRRCNGIHQTVIFLAVRFRRLPVCSLQLRIKRKELVDKDTDGSWPDDPDGGPRYALRRSWVECCGSNGSFVNGVYSLKVLCGCIGQFQFGGDARNQRVGNLFGICFERAVHSASRVIVSNREVR